MSDTVRDTLKAINKTEIYGTNIVLCKAAFEHAGVDLYRQGFSKGKEGCLNIVNTFIKDETVRGMLASMLDALKDEYAYLDI